MTAVEQTWIAHRRNALEKQKSELAERITKIKADIRNGLDADSKEQVIQLENRDVLNALGYEAVEEVACIDSALQNINRGTYGICDTCGETIDRKRLEVRPYSTNCFDCASNTG